MSNNRDNITWDDEEDDDDFTPTFETDTDLVKKLRKALKVEQKRTRELEGNLSEISKSQRERILKDVFTSRGVNTKISQFVPADLDASEEAISTWLDQNADVFGYSPTEKVEVSQQDVAALRQMDSVTTGALSPDKAEDMALRIQNAQSAEEIQQLIYGS